MFFCCNQIFINFPWNSLLKGVVTVDDKVWDNVKRISQKNAIVDILVGYNELEEGDLSLPKFNIDYIKNQMADKLSGKGFRLLEARQVSSEELRDYPSSWGKKLIFGKYREFFYIRLNLIEK